MSSADATSSSSIRIASSPIATPSRDDANPGLRPQPEDVLEDATLGGARAVQRVEAVGGERGPLFRGLERVVPRQQRIAHELVGEHHRGLALPVREDRRQRRERRGPRAVVGGQLHRFRAGNVDAIGSEAEAQLLVTPQK